MLPAVAAAWRGGSKRAISARHAFGIARAFASAPQSMQSGASVVSLPTTYSDGEGRGRGLQRATRRRKKNAARGAARRARSVSGSGCAASRAQRARSCHGAAHSSLLLHSLHQTQPTVKLLINGEFVDSKTDKWVDVVCPVSGQRAGESSGGAHPWRRQQRAPCRRHLCVPLPPLLAFAAWWRHLPNSKPPPPPPLQTHIRRRKTCSRGCR